MSVNDLELTLTYFVNILYKYDNSYTSIEFIKLDYFWTLLLILILLIIEKYCYRKIVVIHKLLIKLGICSIMKFTLTILPRPKLISE